MKYISTYDYICYQLEATGELDENLRFKLGRTPNNDRMMLYAKYRQRYSVEEDAFLVLEKNDNVLRTDMTFGDEIINIPDVLSLVKNTRIANPDGDFSFYQCTQTSKSKQLYLAHLDVSQEFRQQGLATNLLKDLEKFCSANKWKKVFGYGCPIDPTYIREGEDLPRDIQKLIKLNRFHLDRDEENLLMFYFKNKFKIKKSGCSGFPFSIEKKTKPVELTANERKFFEDQPNELDDYKMLLM